MVTVERILFALELSSLSESVAEWANLMGSQFNAELHVLHVVPKQDDVGFPYVGAAMHMDDENKLIRNAEKELHKFCQQHLEELPGLKTNVVIGNPAEEIINYIKNEDISIVVMGTHGKSGLDRAIFGSVADRVFRFSPVPVLSVNPHPPEKPIE